MPAILNSSLTRVVEYAYDAWGNIISVDGSLASTLGTANPIRYRSYYYDTETGWYYLQSRYYNPTWGRFISADNHINANGDLIGFNMFAYCSNNPVMFMDPTGHISILIIAAILLFTPVGGTSLQIVSSTVCYAGMAVVSIFNENVRNDMDAIGWNQFNTDEEKVLESSVVSYYKGVPVFRTNMERSGSFGAIFLSRGCYNENGEFIRENDPNTLKHERGHNWQLMMMGIATYGHTVAIPSAAKFEKWAKAGRYYDAPWETIADALGGVTERNGEVISQELINSAWAYYCVSMINFPLAAINWIP